MGTCALRNTLAYTYAHFAYTLLSRVANTHMPARSFPTLLVPLEAIPHLLCTPTSVSMVPNEVRVTSSLQGNYEYTGACWWKKAHTHRQSLALLETIHSQEREQLDFSIDSGLLVGTQSSLRPSGFVGHGRQRWYKCIQLQHFAILDQSLTN